MSEEEDMDQTCPKCGSKNLIWDDHAYIICKDCRYDERRGI